MNKPDPKNFDELMKNSDKFMEEVNAALQNAMRVHKLLGYPMAAWRDGQVVWVPPEELPVKETNGEGPKLYSL